MNRIVFKLTLCCMICLGVATAKSETRWGIVAAGNLSTSKFNQSMIEVNHGFGGGAGLIGEIIIPGIGFAIDGSVLYSLFTSKIHFGDRYVWSSDGFGEERLYNHTIQIPLNLKFKYTNLNGVENTIAPLVYAGPSFAVHLGDGSKGAEAVAYRKVGVGIHVGVGCELVRRVQVSVNYSWGINKTFETIKLDEFGAKNKYWRLQVAYMF